MHIKLTDFGSAKDLNRTSDEASTSTAAASERSSSFVGTAEYVSPELLNEKAAGKPADIWALGCVIFQMLAGRPPFKGSNEYQTFQKVIKLQYSFPEQGFTAEARSLIESLLVLDPEKRLTLAAIKIHPFFHGIQWENYNQWSPPPILPGLAPPKSPGSASRSESPARSTYSAPGDDIPPIAEQSPTAATTANTTDIDSPWVKFLYKDERIVHSGRVVKRKGLIPRKRFLILTNKPRLLYIDENKMKEKGEIPWSADIDVLAKDNRVFHIRTVGFLWFHPTLITI
jgi:3-phosphoinositide dependent protein kinase-1